MHDINPQAECLRILGQALLDMADVLGGEVAHVAPAPEPVVLPKGSQRSVPVRQDGSPKMWARPKAEKDKALFIVLDAFVSNGGVITKEEFKRVARSVGYDTRGLASFSTTRTDLVKRDPNDREKRVLTETGYRRHRALRATLEAARQAS